MCIKACDPLWWRRQLTNRIGWSPEKDIYDSVLVAALGCVRIKASTVSKRAEEKERDKKLLDLERRLWDLEEKAGVHVRNAGAAGTERPPEPGVQSTSSVLWNEQTLANRACCGLVPWRFLGVGMDQETEKDDPVQVRVHPVWLLMPCTILFLLQTTFLVGLEFSLDPAKDFLGMGEQRSLDDLLLATKCCMVGVLQLMSLKELLVSLHGMHISLNPWILRRYINYADKDAEKEDMGRRTADRTFCLLVLNFMLKWLACILAKAMQFIVAFLCLRMGLNVILQAETVKDVIFNGLVLGFITDLDETTFSFIATTWNIDGKAYEEYEVPADSDRSKNDACDALCACGSAEVREGCHSIGILLRGSRDLLVYFLVGLLYLYQTFDFMLAVDTGVLPAVRDLCLLIRVRESSQTLDYAGGLRSQTWAAFLYTVLDWLTPFVDLPSQFDRLSTVTFKDNDPQHLNFKERCLAAKDARGKGGYYEEMYSKLSSHEISVLSAKYTLAVVGITVLIFAILVMPTGIKAAVINAVEWYREDKKKENPRLQRLRSCFNPEIDPEHGEEITRDTRIGEDSEALLHGQSGRGNESGEGEE